MSYSVELSPNFKREAKRLTKKYNSLKNELAVLFEELIENPTKGNSIGGNVYKIRLSIASKEKGKSGGARIITLVKVVKTKVILLSIYDKGNKENISDKELKNLRKDIPKALWLSNWNSILTKSFFQAISLIKHKLHLHPPVPLPALV